MFNSQANSVFPGNQCPAIGLYLRRRLLFRNRNGTFHVNGITVNKTIQTVENAAAGGAFHIEDVHPLFEGSRFPVRRIVGERVEVWTNIYRDGDDVVDRRQIATFENLLTGERHPVEWGGIRPRIDPARDAALLLRCLV